MTLLNHLPMFTLFHSLEYLEMDILEPRVQRPSPAFKEAFQNPSANTFLFFLSMASRSKVAADRHCEVFPPLCCLHTHRMSRAVGWYKGLAAGAKVRLYKPADEPSKSPRGASARPLKVSLATNCYISRAPFMISNPGGRNQGSSAN